MKNKKLIWIVVGMLLALILTTGTIAAIRNRNNTSNKEITSVKYDVNEEIPLVSEDGVKLVMTEENLEEIEDAVNTAGDMRIIKDIMYWETSQGEAGFENRIFSKNQILYYFPSSGYYVAADVDAAFSDPEYLEDGSNYEEILKKHEIDINENFGIDMSDLTDGTSNYDILLKIAKAHQIDTESYVGGRLDKDFYDSVYEEYSQKIYYCDVTPNFDYSIMDMTKNDYDEITDTYVYFYTNTNGDVEYLSYLTIVVEYTKNNKEFVRELTFSINFYNDDMGCGCGSDTDCDSGNECGTDCDM